MFNHLYNTAKRILSRSPSVQDRSSELRDTTPTAHHLEVSMVTTRRGTETPGQDSSATPQSTVKRRAMKREIEALDSPTVAKRQKRTTPKKKVVEEAQSAPNEEHAPESSEEATDTIAVVAKDITQEKKLPIRRHSSPQVVVDKLSPPSAEIEDPEHAIAEDAQIPTTPTTNKKSQDSPTPRAKRASGRKKQLHSEVKDVTEESEDVASQPKKVHKRFGSEEVEETLESTTINLKGHKRYEAEIADSDDDSASDSDEAPEVVTTSAAASKAAASQQDTARAQLAAQEKERQKREAREQRIATEQAEKRKREEKKAKKLAKQLAKQQQEASADDNDDQGAAAATEPIDLSGLLPASLLSNIPDQRAPTPSLPGLGKTDEELRQDKLNRHIKFLERSEKGVKDVKKGKLSVAVLKQQNKVLPPKASRNTRDVREKWLKGRQGGARSGVKGIGGKVERRAFGTSGFLRGD